MPDETQEREPDGVQWAREVVDDDAPVYATQVSDMREILAHIDRLTRERDEEWAFGEMRWQVERRGAERLADEVAVLIRRGVIDARSPAGDALLDYRDSPSSPRADRLVTLERERDEAQARADNAASLLEASTRSGVLAVAMQENETLRARLARFEALAREAAEVPQYDGVLNPSACAMIVRQLAALAGPAGESAVAPPPVHDDDTGHQELGA